MNTSLLNRTANGWAIWLPIVGWAVLAVALTQGLLHVLLMDLPMIAYHIVAALIQAFLVLVPAYLYVLWRRTAERERAAYDELRRSEHIREELTAMLVHDLKNPAITAAMAIDLLLEAAEDGGYLPDADRQMMVSARRNLRRLEGMIGDVLTINAADAGGVTLHREPTDLRELVGEAVEDVSTRAAAAGIELIASGEREGPSVEVDREHILRVIENLTTNAMAHTSAGGRIEVAVIEADGEAVVSVTDNGDGIDEELSHHLFDRYAQASAARRPGRSSVGLGLAYCKIAVEAHGGRIWARNVEGGGCRFSFALPLRPPDAQPPR